VNMQLRVVHATRFDYDGKAVASYNQARLTPVTTAEQIVVHTRLEVTPKPWTYDYRDYFGTAVTAFEVVDPHDTMTVTASSTVHVSRTPVPPASVTWAELAERELADRWVEYLTVRDPVTPPEDFARRAGEIAAGAELPGQAARQLCDLVTEEVQYVAGATHVHTKATETWQQRAGVCQDMAHLALGGLRSIGIPARYVSGYFHPSPEPEVGVPVAGASHAWVEWWDNGWHPFDVTSSLEPDDRYVVLATGRDYDDVKPVSGIYSGAATTGMHVTVELTRLA